MSEHALDLTADDGASDGFAVPEAAFVVHGGTIMALSAFSQTEENL